MPLTEAAIVIQTRDKDERVVVRRSLVLASCHTQRPALRLSSISRLLLLLLVRFLRTACC